MTASSTRSRSNPIQGACLADPSVPVHGGVYYAYGTGPVTGSRDFEALRSTDLERWEPLGDSLLPLEDCADHDYRAPAVVFGTMFCMYCSVGRRDEGGAIRVATASAPQEPFRDEGVCLSGDEPFVIDPHPFRDDDGRWYLFYARDFLDGERVATGLAVDARDRMVVHAWDAQRAARRMRITGLGWAPHGPRPAADPSPAGGERPK